MVSIVNSFPAQMSSVLKGVALSGTAAKVALAALVIVPLLAIYYCRTAISNAFTELTNYFFTKPVAPPPAPAAAQAVIVEAVEMDAVLEELEAQLDVEAAELAVQTAELALRRARRTELRAQFMKPPSGQEVEDSISETSSTASNDSFVTAHSRFENCSPREDSSPANSSKVENLLKKTKAEQNRIKKQQIRKASSWTNIR